MVIPPKFVDALQAAPESLLSFQFLARERFFARYTYLVSMVDHPDNNTVIKSIKNNLNKNLGESTHADSYSSPVDKIPGDVLPALDDEIQHAISTYVGDADGKLHQMSIWSRC